MDPIILTAIAKDGQKLQATYLPEKGMNLISFKKGELEIIDQSTRSLFEERFAGLGAMIGPHFHRRKAEILPKITDESQFPHIARVKAKGTMDPFSHGIGRYAPWKASFTETTVSAQLTGKDTWNGVTLASLEGQNFSMEYNAELSSSGLHINLSVVSDTDSLVGIHHYYHLPKGTGLVKSSIKPTFLDQEGLKPIPPTWNVDEQHKMIFNLEEEADYTFYPFLNSTQGSIILDAKEYQLTTNYTCASQENCWQLYHPKGASYVCIEPISSQDPRHPNLSVSSINISLEIQSPL
jgi:hypothetical protein